MSWPWPPRFRLRLGLFGDEGRDELLAVDPERRDLVTGLVRPPDDGEVEADARRLRGGVPARAGALARDAAAAFVDEDLVEEVGRAGRLVLVATVSTTVTAATAANEACSGRIWTIYPPGAGNTSRPGLRIQAPRGSGESGSSP